MNWNPSRIRSGICILLAFFTVEPLRGQTSTGSVLGSVADQTGAAVPGAGITLESVATGQKRTASSDEQGNFEFPLVLPGVYRLTVTKQGFTSVVVDDIVVRVN